MGQEPEDIGGAESTHEHGGVDAGGAWHPLVSDEVREGARDILRTVPQGFNRKAVEMAFRDPEKAEQYTAFACALMPHLPPSEQTLFAQDPINFVSAKYVFRGLTPAKYRDLKVTRRYPVQTGHYGSEGVFFSNAPYGAFDFQSGGIVAIVPRSNLVEKTDDGILDADSESFRARCSQLVDDCNEEERRTAVYTVQNNWDISERCSQVHPSQRNVVMRLPQPIEVTEVFLRWKDGKIEEEFPPQRN